MFPHWITWWSNNIQSFQRVSCNESVIPAGRHVLTIAAAPSSHYERKRADNEKRKVFGINHSVSTKYIKYICNIHTADTARRTKSTLSRRCGRCGQHQLISPFSLLYSGVQHGHQMPNEKGLYEALTVSFVIIKSQSLYCRNSQVTGPQNEDLRSSTPGYILGQLQAADTSCKHRSEMSCWLSELVSKRLPFMHPAVTEHATPKSTLVLGLALVSTNSFKTNTLPKNASAYSQTSRSLSVCSVTLKMLKRSPFSNED